jgi:hypothetical protein
MHGSSAATLVSPQFFFENKSAAMNEASSGRISITNIIVDFYKVELVSAYGKVSICNCCLAIPIGFHNRPKLHPSQRIQSFLP